DAVTFISNTGQPFWPASDPHPTHQIYPEFDPKQPIQPGKSWSFTFNRVVNWGYHNHLDSLEHANIIVLDSNGKQVHLDCGQQQNQAACWQQDIETTLSQKGLDAAFDELAKLYDTEPAFSENCHAYTHILGQAAYYEFKKG